MIVVFSYSYGLTGAEVGIAGSQAVLGPGSCSRPSSVTRPCAAAPSGPAARSKRPGNELLAAELARYTDLLDSLALDPETPEQLGGVRHAG